MNKIFSSPKSGIINLDIDTDWEYKMEQYIKHIMAKRAKKKEDTYIWTCQTKPNIDRAIFDVLCLFTDLDTDSMPGQLTMQQFKEQVIEPLQHGKAHLRYSANGILL